MSKLALLLAGFVLALQEKAPEGATVDWIPVTPLPVLTSAFGVLKTAPHPNAARFFAGWMGSTEGQKIRYETSGQAIEVGRNAIGNVADRLKATRPTIILETEKNFAAILEIQRELGKLLGALR